MLKRLMLLFSSHTNDVGGIDVGQMPGLIILCASHVNNNARLQRLTCMLDSIKTQNHPVPLFISISVENEKLSESIMELIPKYPDFTFYMQEQKHSQFEHYALLVKSLLAESRDVQETWCIFTDDDDISHPTRTTEFCKHIMSVREAHMGIVMDTSVLTKWCYNGFDSPSVKHKSNEYITIACRLQMLQEFFRMATPKVLSNASCDLVFNVWCSQWKQRCFHSKQWLYEYTVRDGGNRETCWEAYAKGNCLSTEDLKCLSYE